MDWNGSLLKKHVHVTLNYINLEKIPIDNYLHIYRDDNEQTDVFPFFFFKNKVVLSVSQ